jgi:hypothetical protein
MMPDDPDDLDEDKLVRLKLGLILSEPGERERLRPDAWLLWGRESRELAVAIEAKARGEQYRPQLVWYRDTLLGEGAGICPATSWTKVALLLNPDYSPNP